MIVVYTWIYVCLLPAAEVAYCITVYNEPVIKSYLRWCYCFAWCTFVLNYITFLDRYSVNLIVSCEVETGPCARMPCLEITKMWLTRLYTCMRTDRNLHCVTMKLWWSDSGKIISTSQPAVMLVIVIIRSRQLWSSTTRVLSPPTTACFRVQFAWQINLIETRGRQLLSLQWGCWLRSRCCKNPFWWQTHYSCS